MTSASHARRVVIAGVRNRTHLVYVASYVRHVAVDGPVEVMVLDTGTVLGRSRVSEEDLQRAVGEIPGVDLVAAHRWWERPTDRDLVLLSVGAPGTKAFARMTLDARGRPPCVVVTDEGLGSYGSWRTRRAAYRREGGREPRSTVRAAVVASANRLLPERRWTLYQQGPDGWRLHEEVAAEFRRRLTGRAPAPGTAVYLTQPWPALGQMATEAYAAHLHEVTAACARVGLRLQVRPHPADDLLESHLRGTGLDWLPADGPAELDRAVVEADLVLGSTSTALVNLAAIHGTRVLWLAVPELAGLDRELAPGQRSLLEAFLPSPITPADLPAALAGRWDAPPGRSRSGIPLVPDARPSPGAQPSPDTPAHPDTVERT